MQITERDWYKWQRCDKISIYEKIKENESQVSLM